MPVEPVATSERMVAESPLPRVRLYAVSPPLVLTDRVPPSPSVPALELSLTTLMLAPLMPLLMLPVTALLALVPSRARTLGTPLLVTLTEPSERDAVVGLKVVVAPDVPEVRPT